VTPLDPLEILRALARHEVDFVVIGGLAVGHHGFVRATKDVDIVPNPSRENLERLLEALEELEAKQSAIGDFDERELPATLSLDGLLAGGNWDFETRFGRLDVMQFIDGALESADDYEHLRSNAVAGTYEFGVAWFAGYGELLDLKQLAGRDQDLIDVRALREANRDTLT
jgi:hypothetical protein